MRVRLLTLRTYAFIQVHTENTQMKFVRKALVFVVRLALAMVRIVLQELNAASRRSSKFGERRIKRRRW